MIEVDGASIGWRVHGGCFWVGAFSGEGLGAASAVLAVRKVARSMGFTRMFWQVFPETGSRMLDALKHGRGKVDFIQMYCDV